MSTKISSYPHAAPSTPKKDRSLLKEPIVVTPSSKTATPKRKAQTPKSAAHEVTPLKSRGDAEDSSDDVKEATKGKLFPSFDLTTEDVVESPTKKRVEHRISDEVDHCYRVVNKKTGALGGNGYTGAIYGELTIGSMQKIVEYLTEECEMSVESCFIDVGSGLGKPNFHALHYPGVRLSIGVELETIRWQVCVFFNDNMYISVVNLLYHSFFNVCMV